LLFFILYVPVQFLLGATPALERLVRLAFVVAILAFAFTSAVQWTVRSRFKPLKIQVIRLGANAESAALSNDFDLTLRQAARFVWSQVWRSMIVTVPVNVLLIRVLFGTFVVQPGSGWMALAEQFVMTQVIGIVIAIWATREALRLSYRDFRFRCTPERESIAEHFT
jgi:hypothetical protein